MATTPMPLGADTRALGLTQDADVNAGIRSAGMSFATLLKTTGLAVADSSRQLNQAGADMTTALARTQVDVIAAQVTAYDDNGNALAEGSKTLTQKLPLINFIDPVFYQCKRVRLQGYFQASEFVASNETSTGSFGISTGASNTGIGFIFGSGSSHLNMNASASSSDVDVSREQSVGVIRASALLEPKPDIGVPKPRQLISAPSIGILFGPDTTDTATTRSKEISLVCYKADGSKQISVGLPLSVEIDGAQWAWAVPVAPGALPQTSADGVVTLTLSRDFPTPAGATVVDTAPVDLALTVRMGVVSSTAVIRF